MIASTVNFGISLHRYVFLQETASSRDNFPALLYFAASFCEPVSEDLCVDRASTDFARKRRRSRTALNPPAWLMSILSNWIDLDRAVVTCLYFLVRASFRSILRLKLAGDLGRINRFAR